MTFITRNKTFKRIIIVLFWLILWQIVTMLVSNKVMLAGPYEVLLSLIENVVKGQFWLSVLNSLLRIGAGFSAAFVMAVIMAAFSYKYALFEDFLNPLIGTLKSVPVASFVVLLLIWFGARNLAFFVCFLIVLPSIYINTLEGLKATPKPLIEMAQCFHMPLWYRIRFIYKESLMPFVNGSLKSALGMAWKSGVAAEVIGLPHNSIGEGLYMSKVYLETADLFAWTIVTILLSFLFEKLVLGIVRKIGEIKTFKPNSPVKTKTAGVGFQESNISVSFNDKKVLDNVSVTVSPAKAYCIEGVSGVGKTTLLKTIYKGVPKASVVFQEDRLLENRDALTNVCLCANLYSLPKCREVLEEVLPSGELTKPVSQFSGGMKRKVALVRALMYDSGILLLDEPFTGLDENSRMAAIDLIKKYRNGRTLVLVSHNHEDAVMLGAEVINLGAAMPGAEVINPDAKNAEAGC